MNYLTYFGNNEGKESILSKEFFSCTIVNVVIAKDAVFVTNAEQNVLIPNMTCAVMK
ncbi:MAG: hypothetical protein ACYCVD_11100 [Desulfitobacteriaceae bacterium]